MLALGGGYFGVQSYLTRNVATGAERSSPVARTTVAKVDPEPGRIVIHGTGDVNLDPSQVGILRESFGAPWTGVRDLFTSDDLTVVNLECAASKLGEPVEKEYNFRCSPEALPAMGQAGVDVANLGNNHAGDFGKEALLDARKNLIDAEIAPVGAGRDAAEANAPAVFERGGKKIAILGFAGVVPDPGWLAGPSSAGEADGYSIASMTAAVRAADAIADHVFVTIHWGAELDTEPRADDVGRAHALIDAGADGIFGHHAHRVQALDVYKGRPIAWGLGNFVWPPMSAASNSSAIAEFVIEPDGSVTGCLIPATIVRGAPQPSATSC